MQSLSLLHFFLPPSSSLPPPPSPLPPPPPPSRHSPSTRQIMHLLICRSSSSVVATLIDSVKRNYCQKLGVNIKQVFLKTGRYRCLDTNHMYIMHITWHFYQVFLSVQKVREFEVFVCKVCSVLYSYLWWIKKNSTLKIFNKKHIIYIILVQLKIVLFRDYIHWLL